MLTASHHRTVGEPDRRASSAGRTGVVSRGRRVAVMLAGVVALAGLLVSTSTAAIAGPAGAAPLPAGDRAGGPTTGFAGSVARLIRGSHLSAPHPAASTGAGHVASVAPPLTQLFLESGSQSSSKPQASTVTSGLSVSFAPAAGTLVASWSGGSATIAGVGGLGAGGVYSQGGIQISTNPSCNAGGGVVLAEIDQLVVGPSGTVLSLALKFACATFDGTYAAIGWYAYQAVPTTPGAGYELYANDGSLASFGNDGFLGYLGDVSTLQLNQPVVGMATTPDGGGYWMVAGDGGVFALGDAGFFGSTGALRLNQPVVGMAPTPDGQGYWFVASDGGIFAYGDAGFYGSTGSLRLNRPIVGMASTPDGRGYWLVASDGGIFAFGDAGFYGSTGALTLNQPVVGMAPTPDGRGYWFVASDGGVFSFGDAGFYGSTGGLTLNSPIVSMLSSPDGRGYWMAAGDGGIFAFGDASFDGSLGGVGASGVVGMTR